jgi:signal peptidase II
MTTKKLVRTIFILLILGSNVGCDQFSKKLVRQKVGALEEISLIHNYVTLTKIENTGAFLSLGQTLPQPIKIVVLTILPLLALVFALLILLTRNNLTYLSIWGMSFIVGGGIGNIYDRIVHGSVTDFLHIDFGIFETGIFNLADVSIMTGMLMVLADLYLNRTFSLFDEVKKN